MEKLNFTCSYCMKIGQISLHLRPPNKLKGILKWAAYSTLSVLLGACAKNSNTRFEGSNQSSPDVASIMPKEASPIDAARLPSVSLAGPTDGTLLLSPPDIRINVNNYPLEKGWQEAVLVLNDREIQRIADPSTTLVLKDGLQDGYNRLLVYLSRSWGESIKGASAVASLGFFYNKKELSYPKTLAGIYLVSPRGTFEGEAAKKIMFDVLLTQNQGKKYRIYYSLNGDTREISAEGAPYFFYNLPSGNHELRIELMDNKGKPVKAPFSRFETTFRIQ